MHATRIASAAGGLREGGAISNTTSVQAYKPDASLVTYATTTGAI